MPIDSVLPKRESVALYCRQQKPGDQVTRQDEPNIAPPRAARQDFRRGTSDQDWQDGERA